MTGLHTSLASYRAAGAELRGRLAPAPSERAAIVAVPGSRGWADRALAAADAGAVAVVVAEPVVDGEERVDELLALARRLPVVVDRRWMREADVDAALPTADHRAAVASCGAARGRLAEVLRDCLGWLGRLTGGVGTEVRHEVSRGGVLAGFPLADGRTLSVAARELTEASAVSRLRITLLGPTRTEVSLVDREATIRIDDADGGRLALRRYESPERLALRRALAAVDAGTVLDEVERLVADASLTRRLLRHPA